MPALTAAEPRIPAEADELADEMRVTFDAAELSDFFTGFAALDAGDVHRSACEPS